MKRLLLSIIVGMTLVFTSCQYDDSDIWDTLNEYGESIRDHEQRISALEKLCKQMNTNIEALQTLVNALEKRDYITNVSEVRSNGEIIGYTISFANSNTITIYHGEDGKNGKDGVDGKGGKDGEDGYTPQINIMKDTDGIYYWTIDGEWLLDSKGNKIQASGVNGENGTNGITPQLKIENDYWYVSYDDGTTWEQLGKATGDDGADGSDGINGEDGDNIFNSVTQDDEYVYFNLADGSMITLPKHDKENIQFEDLQVKAICCKNWDSNKDGELSYAEAAAVETIGTVFRGDTDIIAFTELKYFTGISEIPDYAFYGCTSLWKITFPKNIISIGYSALYNCKSLSNLIIGNSVTSIGTEAFYNCSGELTINCNIPNGVSDSYAYGVFYHSKFSKVTICDGVTSIGDYAFSYCTQLTSVTIPDSVTSIGIGAFLGCSEITSITIPDNVTSIENYTFSSCSKLESVTIGSSVASIGVTFTDCTILKNIFCKPSNPPAIFRSYDQYSQRLSQSFPMNAGMSIYVPRDSYDAYIQHDSSGSILSKQNWRYYETYIKPYDFE